MFDFTASFDAWARWPAPPGDDLWRYATGHLLVVEGPAAIVAAVAELAL